MLKDKDMSHYLDVVEKRFHKKEIRHRKLSDQSFEFPVIDCSFFDCLFQDLISEKNFIRGARILLSKLYSVQLDGYYLFKIAFRENFIKTLVVDSTIFQELKVTDCLFESCQLSLCYFSKSEFNNVNFTQLLLSDTTVSLSFFSGAINPNAELVDPNHPSNCFGLDDVIFENVIFSSFVVNRTKFSQVLWANCFFSNLLFRDSDFNNCTFDLSPREYGVSVLSFVGCDVKNSTFPFSFNRSLSFDNSVFAFSCFNGITLESIQVTKVLFRGSLFRGTSLTDCRFADTEFRNCDLSGAVFLRCSFLNVQFEDGILAGIRFDHCLFKNVNFPKTSLDQVFFNEVRFESCDGVISSSSIPDVEL